MQLFIFLHDHENVCHNKLVMEFDDQTTLRQFKEKIRSIFSIDKEYQQLFFGEQEIFAFDLNSALSEVGLKNMDNIIV
uniref:Ubiquitin-like domain-containing protein n=1 Tax=Acrobeloides nanus TaxID=290746 RepID=A0A914DFY7_9BILA